VTGLIVVFCELDGEALLGKAREIADSSGDRVVALVAKDSVDPQKLIYLGADEVLNVGVNEMSDWIEMISDMIRDESKLKLVIFPSNIISNVIMGAVYSRAGSKIGYYLDESDFVEGTTAAKSFNGTDFALQKSSEEDTNLLSLKVASFSRPYEDTSRYGRTKELQLKHTTDSFPILLDVPDEPLSSSMEPTILVGPLSDKNLNELAKKLADKYHAKIRTFSGAIEVVYGPCIAVEIDGKLRDLPEFKGDLISLNRRNSPISSIADLAIINSEIDKILRSLL
jgi:hypothetical protein